MPIATTEQAMRTAWFERNLWLHLVAVGFQIAIQPLLLLAGLRTLYGVFTVIVTNTPILYMRVWLHRVRPRDEAQQMWPLFCASLVAKPFAYALIAYIRSRVFLSGPLGCLPMWPALFSIMPQGRISALSSAALGINAFIDGGVSGTLGGSLPSKLLTAGLLLLSLLFWGYVRRETLLSIPITGCENSSPMESGHAESGSISREVDPSVGPDYFPEHLVVAFTSFCVRTPHAPHVSFACETPLCSALPCSSQIFVGLAMAHVSETIFRADRRRERDRELRVEQLEGEKMRAVYDRELLQVQRVQELRAHESSRSSSRPDSYAGHEADGSSNGDEGGSTPSGAGSGSNASGGGGSGSNASSFLRKWGREREAEIEAVREERLVEEWTSGWQEVGVAAAPQMSDAGPRG